MNCIICGNKLSGKQRKYCSRKCQNKSENVKYQHYNLQRERGKKRKKIFIDSRGGGCEVCGYNRSQNALEFHHIDSTLKKFSLDWRNLANRTLLACEEEFKKCRILCANCHREEHDIDLNK